MSMFLLNISTERLHTFSFLHHSYCSTCTFLISQCSELNSKSFQYFFLFLEIQIHFLFVICIVPSPSLGRPFNHFIGLNTSEVIVTSHDSVQLIKKNGFVIL